MRTPTYWLPGLPDVPAVPWAADDGSDSPDLLVAKLTPELLQRQLDALGSARTESLVRRPVAAIISCIDAVAGRFLDAADPLRREALRLLPLSTGLSAEMADLVLTRMAADWRGERLERLLAEDLGDPRVLDGFVDAGPTSRRVHARGPGLVYHVFSGNVPGVGVTSLIRALLVKSASLAKSASGEPVLPALFARAIAEEDAELGDCLAVAYWAGGMTEVESVAMERADVVIAYGSKRTVEMIRERVPPGRRFVEYGNRVSFGIVAREALTRSGSDDLALDAAMAVATFDQQGCVSPHVIYVEEGGDVAPREWTRLLASAMGRTEARLPRGVVSPDASAAIQQLRGAAEVRALEEGGAELHASPGSTAWTVLFDPDPRFEPSCLNRTVRVKPVASIEEVPRLVAHLESVVQTVGVAGPEDRLTATAMELARLGVNRIAPLGEMPWPRAWWHHDGRPPIGELVHWCDWD